MRSSNELNIDSTLVLADVNGSDVSAPQVVAASAQLVIAGSGQSAPAGNFLLQFSDDPPLATAPSNWSTLATTAVSGAGVYALPKTDVCAQWIRALYDNTVSIAQATLVNQSLTYTAVAYGASGNAITIRLLDPGAPSQSLSVSVAGSAITVHLATDGGSAITSTGDDVKAAINGNVSAAALVVVSGSNASPVTAIAATALSGGRDGGTITSVRIKTLGF